VLLVLLALLLVLLLMLLLVLCCYSFLLLCVIGLLEQRGALVLYTNQYLSAPVFLCDRLDVRSVADEWIS
jgi:hypothetical protein